MRGRTAEGDRLDVLVTLLEAWEEKHWPIESPDPVEAILFATEPDVSTSIVGPGHDGKRRDRGLLGRKLHAALEWQVARVGVSHHSVIAVSGDAHDKRRNRAVVARVVRTSAVSSGQFFERNWIDKVR
jgi:hypothetical protein